MVQNLCSDTLDSLSSLKVQIKNQADLLINKIQCSKVGITEVTPTPTNRSPSGTLSLPTSQPVPIRQPGQQTVQIQMQSKIQKKILCHKYYVLKTIVKKSTFCEDQKFSFGPKMQNEPYFCPKGGSWGLPIRKNPVFRGAPNRRRTSTHPNLSHRKT